MDRIERGFWIGLRSKNEFWKGRRTSRNLLIQKSFGGDFERLDPSVQRFPPPPAKPSYARRKAAFFMRLRQNHC